MFESARWLVITVILFSIAIRLMRPRFAEEMFIVFDWLIDCADWLLFFLMQLLSKLGQTGLCVLLSAAMFTFLYRALPILHTSPGLDSIHRICVEIFSDKVFFPAGTIMIAATVAITHFLNLKINRERNWREQQDRRRRLNGN